jgi:3-hydroxyacyl-CoA dehydrogenase
MQLSKTLGEVGVPVGNCRGFVGNRMFAPYRREAQFLVEGGAGIFAVEQALTDFGMAMRPLATDDLAGLDVGWPIRKEHGQLEKTGVPILEDRLYELGRYGQKTGAGWYKYDEQRRAIPDPQVDELVRKWVQEAGITQRKIAAPEIIDRCICALRASDIDIIHLHGYGFPAHRGGPMWYADTGGLKQVLRVSL